MLFLLFQTPVMVTSALRRTCANWTRTGNPCADVTGCARWSSRLYADPTGAPTPTSASCVWRRAKNGRRSAFSSEESAAQVPKYSAKIVSEILRNNSKNNSKNLKNKFFLTICRGLSIEFNSFPWWLLNILCIDTAKENWGCPETIKFSKIKIKACTVISLCGQKISY